MKGLIGQSLGRYHILEQLGEGGMATVYKAYDTRLETEVAVKVIRTEELPAKMLDRALKRFEREAKALARLAHPNIIPIIDYGEHEGLPYLVMKYLPGGTLKERLKSGVIPWREAIHLLLPIARALDYAHRQDVIHRDVKPANILITADGEPMLTDFGVAKIIDVETTVDLTGTAMAVGTPEYMAPEQFQGGISESVDIYALGAVLYEMVTGHRPFTADTPAALIIKQATDPLPRPSSFARDLPGMVEKILLKALAKNPHNRYQEMGEFVKALSDVSNVGTSKQKKSRLSKRLSTTKPEIGQQGLQSLQRFKRRPWLIGFGLISLVMLSALIGWLVGGGQIGSFPTETATALSTQDPSDTSNWKPMVTYESLITMGPISTLADTSSSVLGVGSTWERPADGMTMQYIPAGEFQMGSNDGDNDEKPIHVAVLSSFWMDETEVTNAMYKKCVDAGYCGVPNDTYYLDSNYTDHPAVDVSWFDAENYCAWAGAKLPTEAEWEKASRGGISGKKYPWGNESPTCEKGLGNGAQFIDCNSEGTAPVASFASNGYGLYDMAGNVWEWVADWYDSSYYSNSPWSDPLGPSTGEQRLLRGGSWNNFAGSLRSAFRYDHNSSSGDNIGFRCARSEATP